MQARSIHGDATSPATHVFRNHTAIDTAVLWVDCKGTEIQYYVLGPGSCFVQATFDTHLWHLRQKSSLVGTYQGKSILAVPQHTTMVSLSLRKGNLPASPCHNDARNVPVSRCRSAAAPWEIHGQNSDATALVANAG